MAARSLSPLWERSNPFWDSPFLVVSYHVSWYGCEIGSRVDGLEGLSRCLLWCWLFPSLWKLLTWIASACATVAPCTANCVCVDSTWLRASSRPSFWRLILLTWVALSLAVFYPSVRICILKKPTNHLLLGHVGTNGLSRTFLCSFQPKDFPVNVSCRLSVNPSVPIPVHDHGPTASSFGSTSEHFSRCTSPCPGKGCPSSFPLFFNLSLPLP